MRQKLFRRRNAPIAFVLSVILAVTILLPVLQQTVFASGEDYYLTSPLNGVVVVQGGMISQTNEVFSLSVDSPIPPLPVTGFTCNVAGGLTPIVCFTGTITVKGTASRFVPQSSIHPGTPVPTITDDMTCSYSFSITPVQSDLPGGALPAGATGFKVQDIDFSNSAGAFNGGGETQCKGGEDVEALIAKPAIIYLRTKADATTAADCVKKGGFYDDTTKKCTSTPPAGTGGTNGGNAEEPDVCPVEKGTALRWIACPVVSAGEAITTVLDETINYFLTTDTTKIFGSASKGVSDPGDPSSTPTSSGFYKAWSTFRNLGIGLVAIAGVVMVMSEALGLQIVDAYTVRKVLPRLLIAVIGISLSWSFMYFLITMFNRLGTGTADLIYSSFSGVKGASTVGSSASTIFVQYFGIAGGLLALGVLGILSFLGTLILALLVGIAVLILREGIIIMSVIIAPLAIASYVLPNTAKFANFWWSTFFKALMAFPIITGFIAICKVMALISQNIG